MNRQDINKIKTVIRAGILTLGILAAGAARAEDPAPQATPGEPGGGMREQLKEERAVVKADREKLRKDRARLAELRKEHRAKHKKHRRLEKDSQAATPSGQDAKENK